MTGYGSGFHASHFSARFLTTPGGCSHILPPKQGRINESIDLEEAQSSTIRVQVDASIYLTTDRVVFRAAPVGFGWDETERVT